MGVGRENPRRGFSPIDPTRVHCAGSLKPPARAATPSTPLPRHVRPGASRGFLREPQFPDACAIAAAAGSSSRKRPRTHGNGVHEPTDIQAGAAVGMSKAASDGWNHGRLLTWISRGLMVVRVEEPRETGTLRTHRVEGFDSRARPIVAASRNSAASASAHGAVITLENSRSRSPTGRPSARATWLSTSTEALPWADSSWAR